MNPRGVKAWQSDAGRMWEPEIANQLFIQNTEGSFGSAHSNLFELCASREGACR
jgi:hypothetical protein